MPEQKGLKSAWEILNTNIKTLRKRVEEQEKTIDSLRKELAKEKQTNYNTGWVEHDDKNL
jgi:chaperonin cofactor prefoldin|tara:strand:- start:1236 stop:1415 length:180 start_codon:yes stop_codon:yes gene_type:complete